MSLDVPTGSHMLLMDSSVAGEAVSPRSMNLWGGETRPYFLLFKYPLLDDQLRAQLHKFGRREPC